MQQPIQSQNEPSARVATLNPDVGRSSKIFFDKRRHWCVTSLQTSFVTTSYLPQKVGVWRDNEKAHSFDRSSMPWIVIAGDGRTSLTCAKNDADLPLIDAAIQILVDELGVRRYDVDIDWTDSPPYWNIQTLKLTAIAGRIALIEAGANILGALPSNCVAHSSSISCGERKISYGELVSLGMSFRGFVKRQLAESLSG